MQLAELNDKFRTTFQGGRILITSGVGALEPSTYYYQVLEAVKNFTDFDESNDPHGEHDFGSFTIGEQKFFWKIDYYDSQGEYASEDPTDPDKTLRVLTIMLAEEY